MLSRMAGQVKSDVTEFVSDLHCNKCSFVDTVSRRAFMTVAVRTPGMDGLGDASIPTIGSRRSGSHEVGRAAVY
jgi:hypothetical protein